MVSMWSGAISVGRSISIYIYIQSPAHPTHPPSTRILKHLGAPQQVRLEGRRHRRPLPLLLLLLPVRGVQRVGLHRPGGGGPAVGGGGHARAPGGAAAEAGPLQERPRDLPDDGGAAAAGAVAVAVAVAAVAAGDGGVDGAGGGGAGGALLRPLLPAGAGGLFCGVCLLLVRWVRWGSFLSDASENVHTIDTHYSSKRDPTYVPPPAGALVARVVVVRPDTGPLPLLLLLLLRPLPLALGTLSPLATVLGRHVEEGGGLRGPGDLEEREARGVALDALCVLVCGEVGGVKRKTLSRVGVTDHHWLTRIRTTL